MRDDQRLEDDALMEELRILAARVDPVPPAVEEAAREAFRWRTIDEELAALTYDSLESAVPATVRGSGVLQALAFEGPTLSVEVEVETEPGNRRRLIAQIAPPQPATIEVRHREGLTSVEADELGRFRVLDVPAGPVSLRCVPSDGRAVATEWTSL